jgi:DNA-binding transcriptional regulator YiaG
MASAFVTNEIQFITSADVRLHHPQVRHRAELSIDEAANAAGIPAAFLRDAESERPVPPDAAAVIETLIAQLAMS